MSDNQSTLGLILDKVIEVSERTARMESEISDVKSRVGGIEKEDAKQNILLAEHIAGTEDNRTRLEIEIKNRLDLEARLKLVEVKVNFLPKLLKSLRKIIIYLGSTAAAVYAIGQVLGYWH